MRYILVVLLVACGSAPAPVAEPEPAPVEEPPVEQAPALEPVAEEEHDAEPTQIQQLVAALGDTESLMRPTDLPPTFARALAECPRLEVDECQIRSLAGYDARSQRWIVLDIDSGESTPENVWLGSVSPTEETVVQEGMLNERSFPALRRALGRYRSQAVAPNISLGGPGIVFSLNEYTPLVGLGAPFEGWVLFVDTVSDLDHPEHILLLAPRDLSETIELARRPAPYTPCDGDGWTCEAGEGDQCTPEMLRAEDRLCVQPFGIAQVHLSPDRATLFVGGTAQVAGHGGYPPFHFVVELPPRAREVMAAP